MIYMNYMCDEGAYCPTQGHKGDAGYDLRTPYEVMVPAHGEVTIDTGVHIEVPRGYYGKLESKSGLNVNHSIVSLGGVIDFGYTGSIRAKLYNLSNEPYTFQKGDKVVQIVFMPCLDVNFVSTDRLADTERGENGFGSTGK